MISPEREDKKVRARNESKKSNFMTVINKPLELFMYN